MEKLISEELKNKLNDIVSNIEVYHNGMWYDVQGNFTINQLMKSTLRIKPVVDHPRYMQIAFKEILEYYCKNYQLFLSIDDGKTFVLYGDNKKYKEYLDHDDCTVYIAFYEDYPIMVEN